MYWRRRELMDKAITVITIIAVFLFAVLFILEHRSSQNNFNNGCWH
jgi:hypothetical protein